MSAAPTIYVPNADFSTLAATPITSAGLPGSELDAEFSEIAASLTATQSRLAEIQRDDGAVRNGVVGFLAMSADVLAAFASIGSNYRGQWSAGQDYVSGDLVISGIDNYPYLCGVPHTSSADFNSDFSSGVWAILGYRPTTDNLVINNFSGDGSTVAFNLTKDPADENNTQVYVSGVYQKKSTYTVTGTSPAVLTFNSAPAIGTNNIEVVIGVSAELISSVVNIPNNSVGTSALINLNVTTGKLADGAVTTVKLADSTGGEDGVTTAKIADLNITTAKLADLSVTTAKIAGASVDSSKLAVGSVQTANIQSGAVDNSKLASSAVDSVKLAANAVTTTKIANGAVTAEKLAVGAMVIADASITTAKLADDAVTPEKMAAGMPVKIEQVAKTDPQTIASGSWTDISGLSIAFTRNMTNSKVRVQAQLSGSSTVVTPMAIRILREATAVGIGNVISSRTQATTALSVISGDIAGIQCASIDFIDNVSAVATNPLTYKLQALVSSGSGYINRSFTDGTTSNYVSPISTLTLTEITV